MTFCGIKYAYAMGSRMRNETPVWRCSGGGGSPCPAIPGRYRVYLLSLFLAVAGSMPNRAGAADQVSTRVQIAARPQALPDFSLTNQDARPFRLSELRGGTALIFFGFTNCQSVCPPTMQKLRQFTRMMASKEPKLTTVFISVDGERDTPEVMKAYLEPFMPGFIGLTGDPLMVRDIADTFPAVFFKGMPRDQGKGYDVEHTSQVYVVDAAGRLRVTFYNATIEEMTGAVREVMADGS